jgi:hypothetical protein
MGQKMGRRGSAGTKRRQGRIGHDGGGLEHRGNGAGGRAGVRRAGGNTEIAASVGGDRSRRMAMMSCMCPHMGHAGGCERHRRYRKGDPRHEQGGDERPDR